MKAKKFQQFISEGAYWLHDEFASRLTDFEFEKDFEKALKQYAETWARLCNDYNWNRYTNRFRRPHFAINVKIYEFPEAESINSILGIELTDDQVMSYWSEYMDQMRDQFAEDVDQSYGWVEEVTYGGRSGGWLLISPNRDESQIVDEVQYSIDQYLNVKKSIGAEEIEKLKGIESAEAFVKDPNFADLQSTGIMQESEELNELRRDIRLIKKEMDGYLSWMRRVRDDLGDIAQTPKRFESTVMEDFTDWLEFRVND